MKRVIPIIFLTLALSSCSGWVIQPVSYPTPFTFATWTPSIYSPTPVIIGVTNASITPILATATITPTFFPTSTNMPPATATVIPADTFTPTSSVNMPALQVSIIGCNTGIDITHGMGEVTNAFVVLKNTGNVTLTNVVTTLYALDEGRVHPDKTKTTATLPVGFEVTLKLTVDSTYKQASPIQVETTSDQGTFPREGVASCRDIGVLTPTPSDMNTPIPAQ